MLFSLVSVELALRAASWLISRLPFPSRMLYLRLLSHGAVCLGPLLPACCESDAGFACTLLFCSLPCCAAPVGMALLTAELLPAFGLPPDLLAPSLMPLRRAATLAVPASVIALLLGPSSVPAGVSSTLHAVAALIAIRVVWTVVCACLLMPSVIVSRAEGGHTAAGRRVEALGEGESCAMQQSYVRYTVTRLTLGRGVDALAVVHPAHPDKWIVSLHGNGEYLSSGIDSHLALAASVGCSVIACDYREVFMYVCIVSYS